jgi:hypothetical protein
MRVRGLTERGPLDSTRALLAQVNQALGRWDKWAAAQAAPHLYPNVPPPDGLSHRALKNLRATLLETIDRREQEWLEDYWGRRN